MPRTTIAGEPEHDRPIGRQEYAIGHDFARIRCPDGAANVHWQHTARRRRPTRKARPPPAKSLQYSPCPSSRDRAAPRGPISLPTSRHWQRDRHDVGVELQHEGCRRNADQREQRLLRQQWRRRRNGFVHGIAAISWRTAPLPCRRTNPATVGALAEALVMDAGGLAHTLEPLVRDGLVAIGVDRRTRVTGWSV
jgi:hypothetical protein